MGGGPSSWAVEAYLRAGFPVYATPDAARTFNDDLEAVNHMGIVLVSEDEVLHPPDTWRWFQLCDFDYPSIVGVFESFGVDMEHLDAIAVGVFDHGNAPADVSDRKFRFDYLDERIRTSNRLSAFAYRREDVPASMTRLKAVVDSAWGADAPLVVMVSPRCHPGCRDPLVATGTGGYYQCGNFHTGIRLGPSASKVVRAPTGMGWLLDRCVPVVTNQQDVPLIGHGALMYDQHRSIWVSDYDVGSPVRCAIFLARFGVG
jgi:hypothetical protein